MLQCSPNELLEAMKALGFGAPLTEIEKEVIKRREDVKDKRSTRKRKGTKTTTGV